MSSVSMAAALGSDMFSLQEFSCNLCGASDSRTILESTIVSNNEVTPSDLNCTNFGHGEHFRVVECKKCSMRYCSPRPTFEALIRAYSGGEDSSYVDQEGGRKRTFARALKTVGGGPGKLLDVGCNTGVFLEEAQKKGFECFGI